MTQIEIPDCEAPYVPLPAGVSLFHGFRAFVASEFPDSVPARAAAVAMDALARRIAAAKGWDVDPVLAWLRAIPAIDLNYLLETPDGWRCIAQTVGAGDVFAAPEAH